MQLSCNILYSSVTVLGSSLGSAVPVAETPAAASKDGPQIQREPPASEATAGFSERVTCWTSMAASVGSSRSLAKDSGGVALVDHVEGVAAELQYLNS